MKKFIEDQNGNALIWSLFLILILFTISAVVYSGVTVYTKYQNAETELQRAAIITIDKSMLNANVRDLELDVPSDSAVALIEDNLINTGWTKEGDNWEKRDGEKLIYRLEDFQITTSGQLMEINATAALPLPWMINGVGIVQIPLQVRSSILYLGEKGSEIE